MTVFRSSCIPEGLVGNPCNGLFCTRDHKNRIIIWNPSIRKHKMIPPAKLDAFDFPEVAFNVGIGYDLVNNDYKVVNIVQFSKLKKRTVASDVLVYSLKENLWRRVKDEWPFKDSFISRVGTYLNGNMHWLVEIRTEKVPNNRTVLIAFNLTIEKFQVHPFPVESLSKSNLKVLGGKLCACTSHSVWMMEEYGVASSWSMLYTLPESFLYSEPLVISEDGQEILMKEESKEHFWYDRKKKTRRIESNIPLGPWSAAFQGSLVLIAGDSKGLI